MDDKKRKIIIIATIVIVGCVVIAGVLSAFLYLKSASLTSQTNAVVATAQIANTILPTVITTPVGELPIVPTVPPIVSDTSPQQTTLLCALPIDLQPMMFPLITTDNANRLEEVSSIRMPARVLDIALSGSERWFAVATTEGVCLYDRDTKQEYARPSLVQTEAAAFSPDGNLMGVGYNDGAVEVWAMSENIPVRWRIPAHNSLVTSLVFKPDSGWLVSAGDDGTVRMWEAQAIQSRFSLGSHNSSIRSMIYNLAGNLITGGSDGIIKVWSSKAKPNIISISGHTDAVNSLAVSSNGTMLASGSDDKTVRIWNMADNSQKFLLSGHTGKVLSVAFNPDGSLLASGSDDQTIRLWDTNTGQLLHILDVNGAWVYGLVFDKDGDILISGGGDGAIRMWGASQ